MKKFAALTLTFILALTFFAACGDKSKTPDTSLPGSGTSNASSDDAVTLDDIKAKGELIIGLDDTFAPMGFREKDGSLVGFDIDLAEAVCEKLGVKATFQPIDWNAKEMELSTGKIDCIWNGMSVTAKREQEMSLSQPYLNNKIVVMMPEGVTIASEKELLDKNIGIQAGSAALETVQALDLWDDIADNVTEYPTYDEVILDINAGRLDCMIIDEVFGNYKNSNLNGVFSTAPFDFGDDLYAIGFRKADTDLTDDVNKALAELVEDGTAAEISDKWFGENLVLEIDA